jgi:hypothetical protein
MLLPGDPAAVPICKGSLGWIRDELTARIRTIIAPSRSCAVSPPPFALSRPFCYLVALQRSLCQVNQAGVVMVNACTHDHRRLLAPFAHVASILLSGGPCGGPRLSGVIPASTPVKAYSNTPFE